jgi:hypothetical protein
VRGRDLVNSFLGKKSSFSQVTCKEYVKNSCTLLARFTPNSFLHTDNGFFFSGATRSQKTGLNNM